jgi:hypothetical protein
MDWLLKAFSRRSDRGDDPEKKNIVEIDSESQS